MEPVHEAEEPLASPVWWPFWIAFGVALALRLLWPEIRPLHHDEGVNGWFLYRLLEGYRWDYDPERFHGPFLYFVGAPFVILLGMSETVLRLPVMLASSAMILLLLPLRRRLGRTGVTAAAWLLAVSPSLVYYGRDLIHETYLVALTLALVAVVSLWLETGRDGHLVLAALTLGLLLTVKETAALTLAGLAAGAVAAWWAAGRPPILERLRAVPVPTRRLAALVLAVWYVLLFTSFLTNPWGLVDSFRAFLPWTEKGIEGSGHEKPWPYFFLLLGRFEPMALAAGVLGGAVALWRRNPFGIFCCVWWLGQLAAYTVIPYKTPWLVLNILLPLILSAGVLFGEIGRKPLSGAVRAAIAGIGLLLVAWTASKAVQVSFLRYDDESLGLVYVQTTRELRDLMKMIEDAAARSPEGKPGLAIRFYTNNRWPLPWYLRDYRGTLYLKEVPYAASGDVLIFDPGQEPDVRAALKDWRKYQRRVFT
ncbi:MAG TPA: flippase activity-associated protein Agl23, partial [Thermoanaerobaculia bacterium]|nr:flippase activity-associated protein Agl23 [Thermoanaerobaculia bacterium]